MTLRWDPLPPLPDKEGFASPFAGTSNGALLVAGGANFPSKRPWEGGEKKWYDGVFVLESPDGIWQSAGQLPRPSAYGVAVSTPDGMICAGGGDAKVHFDDVLLLHWENGKLLTTPLPRLPRPCAFMCGALAGDTIFIAGGIDKPDATTCLRNLWAMDVRDPQEGWRELEPCPGSERMLAVAGSDGQSFFLFSGVRLFPKEGKVARQYLRDAWCYTPGEGWRQLADLPRPTAAAPSPAPMTSDGRLLVISGDDGANIGFKPENKHPGFPRAMLGYEISTNRWTDDGEVPFSRATVPIAVWRGRWVVVSGEARPGYRTPAVWALSERRP
jgi:N-acetylneuraminate epimerase